MTITGLLTAGRAAHVRLMVDSCTITRATTGALNGVTGVRGETLTTIYSGVCRIKLAPVSQSEAGDRNLPTSGPTLVIPTTSTAAIAERDLVTITASANAALVGDTYHVIGEQIGSTSTARRFSMEAH